MNTQMSVAVDALNIPKVVRVIKAAAQLRIAVRAYGVAKLRCRRIMRDGDPLVTEWMRVVEAHDALVIVTVVEALKIEAKKPGPCGELERDRNEWRREAIEQGERIAEARRVLGDSHGHS